MAWDSLSTKTQDTLRRLKEERLNIHSYSLRSDFGITAVSELSHSRLRGQPVQFNLEINAYLQLSLSNIWVRRECYPE